MSQRGIVPVYSGSSLIQKVPLTGGGFRGWVIQLLAANRFSALAANLRHEPTALVCRFDWRHLGIVYKHSLRSVCTSKILLFLIFVESSADFVHREMSQRGIVPVYSPRWRMTLVQKMLCYTQKEKEQIVRLAP